jgi:hypothetical protein
MYCKECNKKIDNRNKSGFCREHMPKGFGIYSRVVDKFCSVCNTKLSRATVTGKCRVCSQLKDDSEKVNYIERLKNKEIGDNLYPQQKRAIKKYLLDKQNNKCKICNCENLWNEKELIFVLDHIDGNSSNNTEENFRLICPNCDSQTDTFKSKNKGKGRKYDREYRKNYERDKVKIKQ